MKLRLALTALFCAAALPLHAEGTGLKRLTLRQDLLGWEAVGRVEVADEGYCTGTLIAPRLVLTAAHCVFDSDTGKHHDPARLNFRAGLRDGKTMAERATLRLVVDPQYDPARATSAQSVSHDVAILELTADIPVSLAAPFGIKAPPPVHSRVSVLSYANGRDEALSWQRGCSVLDRQGALVAVDCDVSFGSSGAPVFDTSQRRPQIVSIISAGDASGERKLAWGMELPAIVASLKEALRTGAGVTLSADAAATVAARSGARRLLPGADRAMTPDDGGAHFLRP